MTDKRIDELLAKVEVGRRDFVRRVVAGAAFAVPIITSFTLDGLTLKAAHAQADSANQSDL